MRKKGWAGLLVAVVLGVCPLVGALAAAAPSAQRHSCCPAPEGGSTGPVLGDCCLRAPSHGRAVLPDLRAASLPAAELVSLERPSAGGEAAAPRAAPEPLAAPPPPSDRSPRSPPAL